MKGCTETWNEFYCGSDTGNQTSRRLQTGDGEDGGESGVVERGSRVSVVGRASYNFETSNEDYDPEVETTRETDLSRKKPGGAPNEVL